VKTIQSPLDTQPQQAYHTVWAKTSEIWPDEKALLLIERDEMAPDSYGFRRYQSIFVVRDDHLAKYMEDMGPAHLFLASGFDIPGGDPGNPLGAWEETVGSLREWADTFREWLAKRRIQREVPDLINGFYDQVEQEHRAKRRMSQSGPLFTIERR